MADRIGFGDERPKWSRGTIASLRGLEVVQQLKITKYFVKYAKNIS